ncbi:sensor histidine kinase [Cohnella sp. GCM10020058]|uniref:sensor histidine kinase n=1 Tax=Cohnella sp. GCM10020058 TaxID=3317330 RepID=UPI00362699E0
MIRRIGRTIAEMYRKHFAQKLFNKILLIYAAVVIVTLAALSFFIYHYFTQYLLNKEMAREREAVANIGAYLDQRVDAARLIRESLYSNNTLMQDVSSLLQEGYASYLDTSFKRYFNDGSFAYDPLKPLSTFFNGGFDIESLVFVGRSGERYRVNEQLSLEILSANGRQPEALYASGEGAGAQSGAYPVDGAEAEGTELYAVDAELKNPTTLAPIGKLVVRFRASGLEKPNQRLKPDMKGYLLALTRDGDVLYDSNGFWTGRRYPVEHLLNGDAPKPRDDQRAYYTVSTSNQAGVIVAGAVPYEEMRAGTQVLKRWILILTALCISGSVLLTYILILRFSKRTKVIVRAMEKLDIGQWNVRIPLTKGDELYQISSNFNRMCERVNHYIEKVYVSEIKQKNAEIVAMQMQINPHFLYNTLEAIRMNAVAHGVPEVGHSIFLLATLFRTSLKSAMIVELSEEMERCRLYLELFQIRFPERLQVEIDMPEEIARHDIVKLSVQPLVENYVLHGFRADRMDNRLRVEGSAEADAVFVRVGDNGRGIPLAELLKLRRSLGMKDEPAENGSIGLRNVHMRLQMVYGGDYGLTIDSTDGVGTEVILKIPAGRKE